MLHGPPAAPVDLWKRRKNKMAQITKNSLAGQTDVHFMEMALEEARQAAREG